MIALTILLAFIAAAAVGSVILLAAWGVALLLVAICNPRGF